MERKNGKTGYIKRYKSFINHSLYLSWNHLRSTEPGLSMARPKALDQMRLAMQPRDLDTAKTTV